MEVLNQLNEYDEAVEKLEAIIDEANAKCDSQAKEIVRLNSNKLESSSQFSPSIIGLPPPPKVSLL